MLYQPPIGYIEDPWGGIDRNKPGVAIKHRKQQRETTRKNTTKTKGTNRQAKKTSKTGAKTQQKHRPTKKKRPTQTNKEKTQQTPQPKPKPPTDRNNPSQLIEQGQHLAFPMGQRLSPGHNSIADYLCCPEHSGCRWSVDGYFTSPHY